jgi:hypothetical protein
VPRVLVLVETEDAQLRLKFNGGFPGKTYHAETTIHRIRYLDAAWKSNALCTPTIIPGLLLRWFTRDANGSDHNPGLSAPANQPFHCQFLCLPSRGIAAGQALGHLNDLSSVSVTRSLLRNDLQRVWTLIQNQSS